MIVPVPEGAVNATEAVVVEMVAVPIVGAAGRVNTERAEEAVPTLPNKLLARTVKLYDVLDDSPLTV